VQRLVARVRGEFAGGLVAPTAPRLPAAHIVDPLVTGEAEPDPVPSPQATSGTANATPAPTAKDRERPSTAPTATQGSPAAPNPSVPLLEPPTPQTWRAPNDEPPRPGRETRAVEREAADLPPASTIAMPAPVMRRQPPPVTATSAVEPGPGSVGARRAGRATLRVLETASPVPAARPRHPDGPAVILEPVTAVAWRSSPRPFALIGATPEPPSIHRIVIGRINVEVVAGPQPAPALPRALATRRSAPSPAPPSSNLRYGLGQL